jgi:outer membrane receptor protein involved in Fe transport
LDTNDNDFLQFPPAPDSSGRRSVASAYAETVVPLTAPKNHVPLLQSLELTASARFEHFSDFGNTTKPKVGINWKPVPAIMFRASYSEGFTAPSLPLLYAPSQYNTSGGSGTLDPYRNPITNEGGYATRTISSGNRQLQPANSTGHSAGIVVDVPKIKGLSFSADYWEIARTGVISSRSTTEILNTDALLLRAATAQQLAAGTPIGSINLGSGTAAYKGDAAVVRYAVSPTDTAAFANSTNAAVVGQILSISTPFLNLAEDYASGWDLSLNYASPQTPWGRVSFNSDWAYLRKSYTIQAPPNATPVRTDRININGASRWRGTTTASWRLKQWTAGLSAYYIGAFADTGATTTQAVFDTLGHPSYLVRQFTAGSYSYYYKVRDSITYNAFASYHFSARSMTWLKSTTLRLGVINVFDTPPPLASGATGYSTSVYGNLIAGRTWTIDITKQF